MRRALLSPLPPGQSNECMNFQISMLATIYRFSDRDILRAFSPKAKPVTLTNHSFMLKAVSLVAGFAENPRTPRGMQRNHALPSRIACRTNYMENTHSSTFTPFFFVCSVRPHPGASSWVRLRADKPQQTPPPPPLASRRKRSPNKKRNEKKKTGTTTPSPPHLLDVFDTFRAMK